MYTAYKDPKSRINDPAIVLKANKETAYAKWMKCTMSQLSQKAAREAHQEVLKPHFEQQIMEDPNSLDKTSEFCQLVTSSAMKVVDEKCTVGRPRVL
jgi:hypothetical protein